MLLVIASVLGIGPNGMDSIEFLPNDGSVKFLKDLMAPEVTIGSGLVSSYAKESINVLSDNGEILFEGGEGRGASLSISPQEILVRNVDNFQAIDPKTGKVYFDAFAPKLTLNDEIEHLEVGELETNNIVSPIDQNLRVQSDSGLHIEGAEGVRVESKSLQMEAGQAVNLKSDAGAITLSGQVMLDPLALPEGGGGYPGQEDQMKLCICSPSGKIFAVPIKVGTKFTTCETTLDDWKKHPCDE